jgi:hypothetical protein
LPERTGQQRKHLTRLFRSSKDDDMRDFRDAKAMAHSLREALAAKELKVTNSESLELVSKAFGLTDWNSLSAAIHADASGQDASKASTEPVGTRLPEPPCSKELTDAMQAAKADAKHRGHSYLTLEHVLLALIDDPQGAAAMTACSVDIEALRASLSDYVDNDLRVLSDLDKLSNTLPPHIDRNVVTDRAEPSPTAGLARVEQVARRRVALAGRPAITGSDLLIATFLNAGDARSAVLLEQHGMTRRSALTVLGQPNGS